MLSKSRWAALLVLSLVLFVPAAAEAAYTSPSLYDCAPKNPNAADPPPLPDLPPEVEAKMSEAIATDDFKSVCPAGALPKPTKTHHSPKLRLPTPERAGSKKAHTAQVSRVRRGRKHRGRRASASREQPGGSTYWYSWAQGEQIVSAANGINGLFVQQTNEQPYIPTAENEAGAHSLGQLWALNEQFGPSCFSSAETGWSESLGQFKDVSPHLFIFAFDCGQPRGYACNGCGNWVQSSPYAFPNMTLTHNDAFHVYGARMDGNNWWFYYDGQWVGYIPHSTWIYNFPSVLTRLAAGGEVATPNYSTCADMGYAALFGSNPGAAMFSSVWYEYNYNTQSAPTYLQSYASDPSNYATGNWQYPPNHGSAFRYGGPGWC